jgi:hypothetical protein
MIIIIKICNFVNALTNLIIIKVTLKVVHVCALEQCMEQLRRANEEFTFRNKL